LRFAEDHEVFNQYRRLELPGLNTIQYLLDDETTVEKSEGNEGFTRIMSINNLDFLKASAEKYAIRGFEFYGGNDYPLSIAKRRDGRVLPKTFSEMAGAFDAERGEEDEKYKATFVEESFKRMAILRMDVDGLGDVFSEGFGAEGNLTHFSTLSRQLDWFFKGFLNTIWEKESISTYHYQDTEEGTLFDTYKFKDWTQIIYAGGDDLFLVGKWDCLLAFAERIRARLKDWVCGHARLDISGGLVMVTHKYPVTKAAEQCLVAEQAAKDHKIIKGNVLLAEKNAISIFDTPLHWEHEYPVVKNLKDQLFLFTAKGYLPHSFMMGLAMHYEEMKNQIKNSKTQSWRWKVAYQISRQKTYHQDAKDFITTIAVNVLTNRNKSINLDSKYEYYRLLNIAIRWAEYELRSIRTKPSQNERN
jgi:CRISPR-associated protein Csm1